MVTPASWLPEEVGAAARRAGRDLRVVQYPGLDVEPPEQLPKDVAWWCPMGWANRLLATGIDPGFQVPPANLLARLTRASLRRRVVVDTVANLREYTPAWIREAQMVHVKPAAIKMSALPAEVRPWSAVAHADLPDDLLLQVSEQVSFVREWRCIVAGAQLAGISSYLRPAGDLALIGRTIDGPGDAQVTWDAWDAALERELPCTQAATDFVESTLWRLHMPQGALPGGWVLDVGQLDDGTFAVVESNPVWCANPYHCDRVVFADAVIAAQGRPVRPSCTWRGDNHLPHLPLHVSTIPTGMSSV